VGLDEDGGSREERWGRLWDAVYPDMRAIAGRLMERERAPHTLDPTAVVHEAYLRLVDQTRVNWQNRAHFFAVGARIMRRILVDYARRRSRARRGGGAPHTTLLDAADPRSGLILETMVLDQVLSRLKSLNSRMMRVVELRVFGGMTMDEIAMVLGVSKRTVDGDWKAARLWLNQAMAKEIE
jgi:RNA polymerase sigma factor (TIGR02999 family)